MSASLAVLIDAQTLVWIGTADARLSGVVHEFLPSGDNVLLNSAGTTCEYADLNSRGRLGADLALGPIIAAP